MADVVKLKNAIGSATSQGEEPTIVFQVTTATGYVDEAALGAADLRLLAELPSGDVVVRAEDPTLSRLQVRAEAYSGPIPDNQTGAQYASFFDSVEEFAPVPPEEKLGLALREAGVTSVGLLAEQEEELYDVSLFEPGQGLDAVYLDRLIKAVDEAGGLVLNHYQGAGLFLARIRALGPCAAHILALPEVSGIDLPPLVDVPGPSPSNYDIENLPPIFPPTEGAVRIGIIDSGVTSAHPLLEQVVLGEFGVPDRMGSDDEKGHGTSVAGLAAFGPLAQQLEDGELVANFHIVSAKVVDANGRFDSDELVPSIIEQAIRRLHGEFGCSVINISLADFRRIVGGRPSAWATVLDNLARELDLVITVSAGNAHVASQKIVAGGVAAYPAYMLDGDNRIYEPGSAVNSLVVGSVAHSNGLAPADADFPDIVPLTSLHDPSPFSRCGPGYNESIKPDLVEYGGTAVWHGGNNRLDPNRDSCGVLAFHADYTTKLFNYRYGTSFAAPVAAFKAATVRKELPNATANLVRALLALSALHPEQLLLRTKDKQRNHLRFAGYGVARLPEAYEAEDIRPVLTTEDELQVDKFAVYEVPIPTDFQTTKGTRHIRVALAFDPPTRNTRKSYIGVSMGFHLARGVSEQDVFNRFRKWEKADRDAFGEPFQFDGNSWQCKMEPLASVREAGTLQVGTFTAKTNIPHYGNKYFLVVRCEGKWSNEAQRFAVAVQLWHEAEIEIYQQITVPITA